MKIQEQPTVLDYAYDRALKIPFDYQIGLKWHDDAGETIETKLLNSDLLKGRRIAVLKLTSYVGTIAFGAMHYYGRIEFPTHAIREKSGASTGGYMGKNAPQFDSYMTLNVERRLTRVEKDMNNEVIGKVGDYTYRFNQEKDVLPYALKTFKRKFGPGWVLVPEDWGDGEERPILCET